MKPAEATDLAVRIGQTWPRSGIAPQVWEEELVDLDHGRAGTAFVRLRRELRSAPSIAEFLTEYRAVDIADGGTRPRFADCATCGNAGVVHVSPDAAEGRMLLDGVKPCRCPRGDERRAGIERIIARNAAELDRLLPGRRLVPVPDDQPAAAADPLF